MDNKKRLKLKGDHPIFKGKEDDMQIILANYLNHLTDNWFHTPNEIKAKPQYLKKRRKMGVKSGVPDIMVLESKGIYVGLAIEIKANYNQPSETQIDWLLNLEKLGYYSCWTNSLDNAIDVIDKYFNGKL